VGSTQSSEHDASKRFGRLKGTSYGILQEHDQKIEEIQEEPKNFVEQAVTQVREFSKGPQKQTLVDDQVISEAEYPYDTCFCPSSVALI
jgi:inosine/xanthosine triphosphate pyrophosphatase family protein